MPGEVKPQHFHVDFFDQLLEQTDGMLASIATITNFLIALIDDTDILVHILIIFRRLYNFFPKYRKSL